jgi:uncharacterized membrane protein
LHNCFFLPAKINEKKRVTTTRQLPPEKITSLNIFRNSDVLIFLIIKLVTYRQKYERQEAEVAESSKLKAES